MDFGDLSENPFSVELSSTRESKRKSVVTAAKFLLLVVVCLTVTLIIGSQCQNWLVYRLTHDFDTLDGEQKQARLVQIADLGPRGVEPLVSTLADPNLDVARTAYDLLRQAQNDWTILGRREQEHRHAILVESLESIAVHVPDDRTGWGTSLLQQTMMATIDRDDDQSRELYQNAVHALEMMSLSDRSGPSILSDEPLDPMAPRRLTIRSKPLPVSSTGSLERWTVWPPSPQEETNAERLVDNANPTDDGAPEAADAEMPLVYRSGARLQPVQPSETVILRDIGKAHETAFQTDDIQAVAHLVDSPMETFDDKSVMHWLGSPHLALREKAKLELTSRGYDGTQLAIATQIASGDIRTRIDLVDMIARSDAIDPRPWLLMLLEDESRDVRLRVISVLATMNDPSVSQRLRMHMIDERDPMVAGRIRQVLDLR